MSRPRLSILRTPDGMPAPERDQRWVPVSTLAAYEGVNPTTVYTRMLAGEYPEDALKRVGSTTLYCPATIFRRRAGGADGGYAAASNRDAMLEELDRDLRQLEAQVAAVRVRLAAIRQA